MEVSPAVSGGSGVHLPANSEFLVQSGEKDISSASPSPTPPSSYFSLSQNSFLSFELGAYSPSSSPPSSQNVTPTKVRPSGGRRSKTPSESSSRSSSLPRSLILDDFRSGGGDYSIVMIRGYILEFSQDQHGSRFLQQKMETATDEEKCIIFDEIHQYAASLMTDLFGNYVIQKIFEFGLAYQVSYLVSIMKGNILTLCFQTYGCRVVQKAIENISPEDQFDLIQELDGNIIRTVMDQNGNHVIQKCMECVRPAHLDFIIESFRGSVVMLATHSYGCRVVQRALEHCSSWQCSELMEEVHINTLFLVQDQYGNYVVQYVLEHGQFTDKRIIIRTLQHSFAALSKHKYASNVIEKCITHAPTAGLRHSIVEELISMESTLLDLLKDQFGNYVMQKALDCADPGQCKVLVFKIKPHLPTLRKYTYAKHMVMKVESHLPKTGSYL